jgi:hypothetical protein
MRRDADKPTPNSDATYVVHQRTEITRHDARKTDDKRRDAESRPSFLAYLSSKKATRFDVGKLKPSVATPSEYYPQSVTKPTEAERQDGGKPTLGVAKQMDQATSVRREITVDFNLQHLT